MKRRHKERLVFPLIVLCYAIFRAVEWFLEGDHYPETLR